jgi:hypothetical protein
MLLIVGFAIGALFGTRAGDSRRERRAPSSRATRRCGGRARPGSRPPRSPPNRCVDLARALAVALIVPGFFALGVTS